MPDVTDLSEREREILALVANGASNKEIAHKLTISANTVKVHLRNIFVKIGAASRTEAAMFAVSVGLVNPAGERSAALNGQEISTGMNGAGVDSLSNNPPANLEPAPPLAHNRTFWLLGFTLLIAVALTALWFTTRGPRAPGNEGVADVALPRWQVMEPMPAARSGFAAASYENQIYVIAGEGEDGVLGEGLKYDPNQSRWAPLLAKPTAVRDVQAVVTGGILYVAGGEDADGNVTNVLEAYDPRQNRWHTLKPLPLGLSRYSAVAYEGRIYLFGGWNGREFVGLTLEYDPSRDRWEQRSAGPVARGWAGVAAAGGRIYLMGGWDGETALDRVDIYQPAVDLSGQEPWQAGQPLPEARYGFAAAAVAEVIHLVGGRGETNDPLLPLKYFPQADVWQVFESEPPQEAEQLSFLQLVPLDTRLFALGGEKDGKLTGQVISYQAIYLLVFPVVK